MKPEKLTRRTWLAAVAILALLPSPTAAQTKGMAVDWFTGKVIVFNADTNTVLGSVTIPRGSNGDCSVTADQKLGFATNLLNGVWVIDLTTSPPTLASGTNPIPIANAGVDTSLSPDGKFVVVCGGGLVQPISVIDIATRTQAATFALGSDCNSVDVCATGSVLVSSVNTGNVRRLTLDGTGNLSDTGELLFSGGNLLMFGPNNVVCAPGGASGVVVRRDPREVRSYTIPGLSQVGTRALTGTAFSGISAAMNPAGDRVFVRSNGGAVDVFSYDPATGTLGATPLFSIPIASAPTFYGMEQMAVHPDGSKLYVSQPNAVKVYDASNGALLNTITDPALVLPTGICFPPPASTPDTVQIDLKPGGNPNCVNPRSQGNVTLAILGNAQLNVEDIDRDSLRFGGAPALRCALDDVPMQGPTSAYTVDAYPDLVCHFATQAVTWPAAESDCGTVDLTGNLRNGTPIQGSDTACRAGQAGCAPGTAVPIR